MRTPFALQCRQAFLPPPRVLAEEWVPANVQTPPGSEHTGLFTFDLAPHTREVLQAWDDEFVREIYLGWATRCMKTSTMIGMMMCAACNTPRPMAFGSCDEESADRAISDQIYPMLDACDLTRRQIPPEAKRSRRSIRFDRCRVRRAFGGSVSSVAGYPAAYIFGSEWSKWAWRTSTEADPASSFRQRTKGFPYIYKAVLESSPGKLGQCRIWSELYAERTDRRDYYVPCPHCREYQTLKFERIRYDVGDARRPDLLRASETAVYLCEHCDEPIKNEDRPPMMRAGRWLSEGQTIDKRGRIHGERRAVSPYVGFGPLSSLYSLLVSGWDQIVLDYLRCDNDPDKLRDFRNSTLALVYDPTPVNVEPDELGRRLSTDDKPGTCPLWSVFLTLAVDVQPKGSGWEFPWQVCCWGAGGRGAIVDYGTAQGWAALDHLLQHAEYSHADGGRPLRPAWRGIDSGDGNSQEDVYAACRRHQRLLPLKGSNHQFAAAFLLSDLNDARPDRPRRKSHRHARSRPKINKRLKLWQGAIYLVLVNTDRSQRWLQRIIEGRAARDEPNWFSLPKKAAEDPELLQELLNEVGTTELNANGYQVVRWQRRDRGRPNDQRDLVRYNWALANIVTNHGADWWVLPGRPRTEPKGEPPRKRSLSRGGDSGLMGGWQPT